MTVDHILKVADDVIVAVDQVGVDVHVKFADSTLDRGQVSRLVAGWSRFTHSHAVFCYSLQRTRDS